MVWQRSAIEAAALYLRELIERGATDARTQTVYDGLLDMLEPARFAVRIQRAVSADAAVAIMLAGWDRRSSTARRGESDRRAANNEIATADERRSGVERRTGLDRRLH